MTTFTKPLKSAVAAAFGIALCLGVTACSGAAQEPHTITVSATAEVLVVPDKASIGIDIQSVGPTPDEAQAAHAEPVNAVIAALRDFGIEDTAIQTVWTDVSPNWNDDDEADGYLAQTRLSVSGLSVDDVAAVMDICLAAGATGVDGPDYTTGSYDDAYQEALVAAVEASRPKAEAIAGASGRSLGQVVSVTEGYQDISYRDSAMGVLEEAETEDGLIEIAPGQVSVTAEVTVSYEIN